MKHLSQRISVLVSMLAFGPASFAHGLPELEKRIIALEAALAATQAELAHVKKNTVLELNGKLKLSKQNGYATALFTGVNVQVVNGLGKTDSINGLGNLIVGYSEPRVSGLNDCCNPPPVCSNGGYRNEAECTANGFVWASNHKSGSHNIVGGGNNAYSSYGGLVVGQFSAITNNGAIVTGGLQNLSAGAGSSVSGGTDNSALGDNSSVIGGVFNTTNGYASSVSGGGGNLAFSIQTSVSGGQSNTAYAPYSSVSGGYGNRAGLTDDSNVDYASSISGGAGITITGSGSWAAGGLCQPPGSCQQGPVSAAKRVPLPKLPGSTKLPKSLAPNK